MKKFLSGLLIGLILTTATPVVAKEIIKTIKAKENIVTIKYNNISKTKQKIYVINNQVYIPLTTIGNLFNKLYKYDSKKNSIIINDKPIALTVAQKYDKILKDSLLISDNLTSTKYEIKYELSKESTVMWNTLNLEDQKTYLKTRLNELRSKYPYKNLYIYSLNDNNQQDLLEGWYSSSDGKYDFWKNNIYVK